MDELVIKEIGLRSVNVDEIDTAMQFIDEAKKRLKSLGIDQWQKGYPDKACIIRDVMSKKGYFLTERNDIAGYLCIDFDGEPAYNELQGHWRLNEPYVVVHRMAIGNAFRGKGMANFAFRLVEKLALRNGVSCFRVDTDVENQTMQHILKKNGFYYCGIICFDNSDKIAFEKAIIKVHDDL